MFLSVWFLIVEKDLNMSPFKKPYTSPFGTRSDDVDDRVACDLARVSASSFKELQWNWPDIGLYREYILLGFFVEKGKDNGSY